MSAELKFIVSELKKPPWEKDFSIISFDSLPSEQVLQVLTDVLAELDPKNKVDIHEENPEKMAVRMLSMLRALKYRPPGSMAKNFRRNIVEGDKAVVFSILQWILEKPIAELKRRVYLAKYLVKVELPPEVMSDPEATALYQQYEKLMDEFKAVHREREAVLGRTGVVVTAGEGGGDVVQEAAVRRSDLAAMEREKEQVTQWLDKMKAKVEGVAGAEQLLSATRSLREERVRAGELSAQRDEQCSRLSRAEEAVARLRREAAHARREAAGATPQGLLRRLEEELRLSCYLAKEKLPMEASQREAEVEVLREVAAMEPPPSGGDIDALRATLNELIQEISKLAKPRPKHGAGSEEVDEQLAPFRQQAALTAKKKTEAIERLAEARKEVESLEEELREEEEGGGGGRGGEEEAKEAGGRGRAQLGALKAELGVVVRSLEVLRGLEEQKGAAAQLISEEPDSYPNNPNEATRANVAALQKELRLCREQYHDMKTNYDKAKRLHDSAAAGIEAEIADVEQELRKMWEDLVQARREQSLAEAQLRVLGVQHERLMEQGRPTQHGRRSGTQRDHSSSSFWEVLGERVSCGEREGRRLREEQRVLAEGQDAAVRQVALWTRLTSLLEVKKKCLETPSLILETVRREKGSETLVLP